MSNLEIWNALGKTDPAQTKGFKRGGGFTGTAIKPVYTEQKMTEQFGPCGIGWGFSEPNFQLVPGSEGQTAVYCWLTLWFVKDGKRSDPIPGVGGDLVVVKQSAGLRTDDEAFKKAFTDAISNAMKHLGMSADVHMGLFDDSKYVSDLRNEKAQERDAARAKPQPALPSTPFDDPEDRTIIDTMLFAMKQAKTRLDLEIWGGKQAAEIEALPESQRAEMRSAYAAFRRTLPETLSEAA